ncbi:Carboxypeptidase M [Hypsibius exemplaris]|uniref:Carboxypeptidase M n=1 Tax=Hypsibius exemplaris TaxID=2072580 RepID=A0A1W0WR14_HYPEX|nr:Carboxypeptidase M [Hypsibius exemplaris]
MRHWDLLRRRLLNASFTSSPRRRRTTKMLSKSYHVFVLLCWTVLWDVAWGLTVSPTATLPPPLFQYNNYLELTGELHGLHRTYPNLTRLYSLGRSERGRELWVLALTLAPEPGTERPLGRPAVKFVGNMHGNEPVGRALLIHFAHHMLQGFNVDLEITKILNTTEIHLLPTMNPDGFESAEEGTCSGTKGRYNSRGADLNRNFPDFMRKNFVRREKETKNVIKWLKNSKFVLSANFHGGAVVASYPWDNYAGFSQVPKHTLTEDHDIFYHLASTYAQRHQHMHTGLSCGDYFEGGVTNGAAWFPLTGGMQDFNYVVAGVMEITLEVSCCKFPPRSMLKHFWEENKEAMIEFVQGAQLGVKGLVLDEMDEPIPHSFVAVQGRSMEYETSDRGEYWRLLLPGNYTLRAFASGYYDEVQRVSFGDQDMPLWVEFRLKRKNQRGEFLPPQVFNELPFEFIPMTTSMATIATSTTTVRPTMKTTSIVTTTTMISSTPDPEGAQNITKPEPKETVPSSTMTTVASTETPPLVLDKEQPNTIVNGQPSNPSAIHIVYGDSGDSSVRRYLPEGPSDMQAKVISQMRSSKQSSFFEQFSAGLAPRTKYHRRVLESLFPFAVANFKLQQSKKT